MTHRAPRGQLITDRRVTAIHDACKSIAACSGRSIIITPSQEAVRNSERHLMWEVP
jgi:hypothetical protein